MAQTLLLRMKNGIVILEYWWFLIKLNTCVPCEPALPILGIHPKDMKAYVQKKKKKTYTVNVTAALLIICQKLKTMGYITMLYSNYPAM